MSYIKTITVLAMAAIISGCLGGTTMEVPGEFVPVERTEPYDLKTVSADGVVLARRTQENPKNGTLEFWAQAIGNQLSAREGYKLADNVAVTSESGVTGRLMTFDALRSGAAFKYLVAVFVKGDKVIVVEAGGRAESVTKLLPQIRTAMMTVK
ncbi:MAG: hypothetical protein LLG01_07105 [Planctomycetaceae bacterium]|nr:hypothetical protein [Planctomycetaceae bacterium]